MDQPGEIEEAVETGTRETAFIWRPVIQIGLAQAVSLTVARVAAIFTGNQQIEGILFVATTLVVLPLYFRTGWFLVRDRCSSWLAGIGYGLFMGGVFFWIGTNAAAFVVEILTGVVHILRPQVFGP